MQVLNFIIKNILTQAAVVVGLIATAWFSVNRKTNWYCCIRNNENYLRILSIIRRSSVIQGSLAILVICLIRLLDLRVL